MPSFIINPLWEQFAALLPKRQVCHPLGCHRPRISDRIVFDKLVQVLVFGIAYVKIADSTCSATTLRARRDEWITAGLFARLEQLCVDGCVVKAPCGGEAAGKSAVDRAKQGTKRSLLTDQQGVPLACVIAPANCHDSPLLRPTLEQLGRFELRFGLSLPPVITVHLDAGYDSAKTRDLLDELGCHGVISTKRTPLQAGARWVLGRTNS